jgi:hypothetical protein
MRKLRASIKDIRPLSEIPSNSQLLWQNNEFAIYYIYDIYAGEVQWVLVNKTYTQKYVSLLRGAVLEIQGQTYAIPKYIFGNAFAEVYFANNLSSYISNLNDIPLYSLAILKSPSGQSIVGFVFSLPPKGVLVVPEYGFYGLQSLEAELLEVSPGNLNLYVIIYDYAEIIEYEQQTGLQVQAPPDPYAVFSYQFNISDVGTVVTSRVILEIPQSDVNFVNTLINDIKKFFHKL